MSAPSDGSPAPAIVTRSVTATLGEAPVDPLGATSTWTTDNDAATSLPSETVPPRGPRRNWLLIAGGAAALVLLGVIIITITNKDGTKTRIEVPADSKIELTASPIENQKSPIKNSSWHGWPADAPPPAIAPFNTEQARQHQAAWAKYLQIDIEYTNSLGMKFVLIPPGEFTMGSTAAEIEAALKSMGDKDEQERIQSEGPQHKVILTQPIYLGVHEVTQAEYEKVMGSNPSHFAPLGMGKEAVTGMETTDHPVETVSWNDAQLFLKRLNQQEPSASWVYRLPKADEWEYACCGGPLSDKLDSAFYFYFDKPTNQLLPDQANVTPETGKGLQRTCKIGSYQPNRLGLYDMHGNVEEWCDDEVKRADGVPLRAIRGGNWNRDSGFCRADRRDELQPSYRNSSLCLRVARVPVGPAKPKPVATTPSAPASNYTSRGLE